MPSFSKPVAGNSKTTSSDPEERDKARNRQETIQQIRDTSAHLAESQHQRGPRALTIRPPRRAPSLTPTPLPPAPVPLPPAPVQTASRITAPAQDVAIPTPGRMNTAYNTVPRRVDSGYQGSGSSVDAGGAARRRRVDSGFADEADDDIINPQDDPPVSYLGGPLFQSPTSIQAPSTPWESGTPSRRSTTQQLRFSRDSDSGDDDDDRNLSGYSASGYYSGSNGRRGGTAGNGRGGRGGSFGGGGGSGHGHGNPPSR